MPWKHSKPRHHLVDTYQDANLCCVTEGSNKKLGQTLKQRDRRLAGYIRRDPIRPRTDGVPSYSGNLPCAYAVKSKDEILRQNA